jgi:predicted ATPase
MFRLIALNINDPNLLGHIPEGKLVFVPGQELKLTTLPYTSVIIGSNGTGKSTLLSYLAKIFEDLKYFQENKKRNPSALNFTYGITYQLGKKVFKIEHRNDGLDLEAFKDNKRKFKWTYNIYINNKKEKSKWTEVLLPDQVIAVSYLPMDRFRQKRNLPTDFYQYLGLRHRSNAASPQYFLNNTLPLLFNYISESKSIFFLKDILNFMSLDQSYLGIRFEYRYKKYFFTGDLTYESFGKLFDNPKSFSKREGTSFALDYYKRYIKEDKILIKKIITYLNYRSTEDNITFGEKSMLEFNLFDNIETIDELYLVQHLQKLDLLSSSSLLFRKNSERIIDSQELSSGEFHFLTTMIAIQSTLRQNSLILIDEPDTSLHPNWQMKYVDNLKSLFKKWNSSHFIMATHSHFIISDLENESSEVIGLTGQVPNIKAKSFNTKTYGCSAEEVLLEIFGLATTRNQFVYEKVGEILEMISVNNDPNNKEFLISISNKIQHLRNKGIDKLSQEDPLKEIIDNLIDKYATN